MFDFATPNANWESLPSTQNTIAAVDLSCRKEHPAVPTAQAPPRQEAGQRPARPLPYDIAVVAEISDDGFRLHIDNKSAVGVSLAVHADGGRNGPWYYAIEAGKSVSDTLPLDGRHYAFTVHGPNGFLRSYRGDASNRLESAIRYEPRDESLIVTVTNRGASPLSVTVVPNDYLATDARTASLATGASREERWSIAASAHWYDVSVTLDGAPGFEHRYAGHFETGSPSLSDPALGRR